MTTAQQDEARARLDAHDRSVGIGSLTEDPAAESAAWDDILDHAEDDLRLALDALDRVRSLTGREGNFDPLDGGYSEWDSFVKADAIREALDGHREPESPS